MSLSSPKLADFEPSTADMIQEVVVGLDKPQKKLPTALLYDARGSELFEQICELPEYYPTRTELAIMRERLPEMAAAVGPNAMIIEYGSGSGIKTRLLLQTLHRTSAYVPVESSRQFLLDSAQRLQREFPEVEVLPVCANFTEPFELPTPRRSTPARRVLYFPGSTIGNFTSARAIELLKQVRALVGETGGVLLGVDLKKDIRLLESAYNDSMGVTAAFNLNLLVRANRELGCDFDLKAFKHRAVWNEDSSAIEMRLYATSPSSVNVHGRRFSFAAGEWIHTEDSHKYTLERFRELASQAGFRVEKHWLDDSALFSVQYLCAQN